MLPPPLSASSDTAQALNKPNATFVKTKVDDQLQTSILSFTDPATSAKFKKRKVKPVVPLDSKRPTSTPKVKRSAAAMSMDDGGDQDKDNRTLKNILDNEDMWH